MKKLLSALICTMLLGSPAAMATNWYWLESNDQMSYYVDKDSIQRTGQYYDRKSEFLMKMVDTNKKSTYIKYQIDLTYKTLNLLDVWVEDADGNTEKHYSLNTLPKKISTPIEMKMYQLVYYPENTKYNKTQDKQVATLFSITDNSIYGDQYFFLLTNLVFYGINPQTTKEDPDYLLISILATRSPATNEFYENDDSTILGYSQVINYNLKTKKFHVIMDCDMTGSGIRSNKLDTNKELDIEPDMDIYSNDINKNIYETSMQYIESHPQTIQHANNFSLHRNQ